MSGQNFQPVEIDLLDQKLAETATRKRIPTLNVTTGSEPLGEHAETIADPQLGNKPAPRKPISVEMPDYLATALKVAAA